MSSRFQIESEFQPTGDQPRAIAELVGGLERGDPYQTLLGATGTGKSVGYDDPVFVAERVDGHLVPHVGPVGPLIDGCIARGAGALRRVGDTDVLDLPAGRFFTQAYDPATGDVRLAAVAAFTRHSTPASVHRLTTACGRTATLTGDHNLWVLRDGRLVLIETANARPGDYLPLPDALPSPDGPARPLDTPAVLDGLPLYARVGAPLLAYAAANGAASIAAPMRGAGVARPYGVLHAARTRGDRFGKMPVAALRAVAAATAGLGGTLDPAAVHVGRRHGQTLPAALALTPSFLFLTGLYAAEGCRSPGLVLFANRDEGLRARLFEALADLGHTFHVRPSSDVQVSSRPLADLLDRLCGHGAHAKRLPSFWPTLSDADLGTLLRAYFDGGGTVGRASDVSATTASERLASDLAYALLRLGIHARIAPRRKRATNGSHAGGTYHVVTVSGQADLRRFRETVGFSLGHKRAALDRECKRRSNSNVDVVPLAGADLRALRVGVGLTCRALGAAAALSRSAVGLYEAGQRRPSRAALARLVDALGAEALRRDVGEATWWETLGRLRRLTAVRWTPVASVMPVAYDHPHVYDFTVPGPETFVAGRGGLFVHNTFAVSNVVREVNRPTLVMSHNKTLAAQLYAEFKGFFPENAVEFFISYYDYYQPEAYIVHSDTYIEKDMAINEQIDRLRLRATSALVSGRKDVLIVASVSCIYGLGSPDEYKANIVQLQRGQTIARNDLLHGLVSVFYNRNDVEFTPGTFRVRGDVVEVFPAYMEDTAYRIAFWGDEVERLSVFEALTGREIREEQVLTVYPAKIFVTPQDQLSKAIGGIEEELRWRLAVLRENGKLLEAQRLEQRTLYDIEMMKEVGYCTGIENYSRHLTGLPPGHRPYCLFDYFPDDMLLVVDESHVTIPQVRAMYNGDRARKLNLVEHGFRLPSALDNRPMTFEEFEERHHQVIFVSATPGDYELEKSNGVFVEQIIRPTGIPDPVVEVRKTEGQIDDLLEEVRLVVERGERVLVTTLTKRMAEDLTDYLDGFGVGVRYLHSDIDALERVEILRDLRLGAFDVLIGVNLLREGLDLPEVSLVAILDADKEGFLRSDRSLIQTAGRAARNAGSKVILYADTVTGSMARMMEETGRRREIQLAYNAEHGITPRTVKKSREQILKGTIVAEEKASPEKGPQRVQYDEPGGMAIAADPLIKYLTADQKRDLIGQMQREMLEAAEALQFERAAELRDSIGQLEKQLAA